MFSRPTVLVLGAGASFPYGFPTGYQLRAKVLQLRPHDFAGWRPYERHPEKLHDFLNALNRSGRNSIDSFIGQRQEFRELACVATARVLLRCENEASVVGGVPSDDWYQLLYSSMTEHQSWESLDFSALKVITFNYDRSLEFYLSEALQSSYGKSEAEAAEKLDSLKIRHVYGCLGDLWKRSDRFVPFHNRVSIEDAYTSGEYLQLMADTRDTSDSLEECIEWLSEADAVGVLGFGFDALNLRRLESDRTMSSPTLRRPLEAGDGRLFVATCLGLTPAEACRAATRCGHMLSGDTDNYPYHFRPCDSTTLLRQTLLLD